MKKNGFLASPKDKAKILGDGELKRSFSFEGFSFSESAKKKVAKAGGTIR